MGARRSKLTTVGIRPPSSGHGNRLHESLGRTLRRRLIGSPGRSAEGSTVGNCAEPGFEGTRRIVSRPDRVQGQQYVLNRLFDIAGVAIKSSDAASKIRRYLLEEVKIRSRVAVLCASHENIPVTFLTRISRDTADFVDDMYFFGHNGHRPGNTKVGYRDRRRPVEKARRMPTMTPFFAGARCRDEKRGQSQQSLACLYC